MAEFPVMKMKIDEYTVLMPCTDEGIEAMKSIKYGDIYKNKITKPRNYKYHQKFFK